MDSLNITDSSAHTYVQLNGIIPFVTIGQKRSRLFPDLPTIFEAAQLAADQQWLFDFRHVTQSLGRILVVPPGMTDSRLAFMEAAVKKANQRSEFPRRGREASALH